MSDAADRLARSRLAIIAHVHQREQRHERGDRGDDKEEPEARAAEHPDGRRRRAPPRRRGHTGWFGHVRNVVGSWWRHHPAHMAVELAEPALAAYGEKRPFQYLGIAALVGAVLVLARPWRLVSMTGLLLALLKSSQLSSVVLSAMSGVDDGSDHRQPP